MRRSLAFISLSILLAAAVAGACKQKTAAAQAGDDDDDGGAATTGDNNTDTTGDGTSSDDGDQVAAVPSNGIPCDVESVLENRCLGCHGATNPQGPPLLKYEDFSTKSTREPDKTRGQVAAELMKAKTMPKAPGVALDAEIATVDAWVTGGMAKSTEACTTTPADAGTGNVDSGTVDSGTTTSTCLSGKTTSGESGKGEMHPGKACLDCHSKNGGPPFLFAGTVFDGLHQPDECFGSNEPVKVTIVGKRNGGGPGGGKSNVYVTTINPAGNFFVSQDDLDAADVKLTPPFAITLTQPGKPARKMNTRIPSGDCNSCHTVDGTAGVQGLGKPPGRIVSPGVAL